MPADKGRTRAICKRLASERRGAGAPSPPAPRLASSSSCGSRRRSVSCFRIGGPWGPGDTRQ